MKKVNLLSRAEMKKVLGGNADEGSVPGGDNGNPCANGGCTKINHQHDNGDYGTGPCPPSSGGTSCHNYCADGYGGGSGYYGWC